MRFGWRWRGQTDVEHDHADISGPAGNRIGARDGLRALRRELVDSEFFPFGGMLRFKRDAGKVETIGRCGDLHEIARSKVELRALRQGEHDFLDQRRDTARRCHTAVHRGDAEHLVRDGDGEVVSHDDLAGEPHSSPNVGRRKPGAFRWQRLSRARDAADAAQAARSRAGAARGHGDAIGIQNIQQLEIRQSANLTPAVDGDRHGPRRQQVLPNLVDNGCQRDEQQGNEADAEQDLRHSTRTPTKAENAMDRRPVTMKAMPRPCNPSGTLA